MIRTGCHTLNFGNTSLEEALSFISRLGFASVDVAASSLGPGVQIDQSLLVADPEGTAARISELAGSKGVELEELFLCSVFVDGRKVETNEPDDRIIKLMLDAFDRICLCAQLAGFKSVMGVPGILQETLGWEGSFERSARILACMLDIARNNGIKLNVEPHRGSIIHQPRDSMRMVREVAGLGLTLDFLHYEAAGIDQREAMPLLEHANHMHARQARPGWPKCPVEQGTIDYGAIIKRLKELDWDGCITMEFWNGPKEDEAGINPVFQNIVMAYQLENLIKSV